MYIKAWTYAHAHTRIKYTIDNFLLDKNELTLNSSLRSRRAAWGQIKRVFSWFQTSFQQLDDICSRPAACDSVLPDCISTRRHGCILTHSKTALRKTFLNAGKAVKIPEDRTCSNATDVPWSAQPLVSGVCSLTTQRQQSWVKNNLLPHKYKNKIKQKGSQPV